MVAREEAASRSSLEYGGLYPVQTSFDKSMFVFSLKRWDQNLFEQATGR